MDGTCGNELKIAELGLQLGSFGVQRGATRGHAVVGGPSDVVGIDVLDRGTPVRRVALVEDLEKVGVHQFSDRGAHRDASYPLSGVARGGTRTPFRLARRPVRRAGWR